MVVAPLNSTWFLSVPRQVVGTQAQDAETQDPAQKSWSSHSFLTLYPQTRGLPTILDLILMSPGY